MAFNNGFPIAYSQMYAQPAYQPPQPQNNTGITWIQGESAAKSYLVAPNTTVVLFDSESQTIYLKSADSTGLPNMRILDYTIRDQSPKNGVLATAPDYATKQEISALRAEIDALKAKLEVSNEPTVRADERK